MIPRGDERFARLERALERAMGAAGDEEGCGAELGQLADTVKLSALDQEFVVELMRLRKFGSQESVLGTILDVEVGVSEGPSAPELRQYRVISELGRGGCARVLLAWDSVLKRNVALKFVRPDLPAAKRSMLAGLLVADAQAIAQIEHPNVIRIHTLVMVGGSPWLVLQYVPDGSLQDLIDIEGALPWERAGRYVADIGDALLEVHGLGVLHRDVKPANILWDSRHDEARLTDFGLAVRMADSAPVPAGTVPFMAPEAFSGDVGPSVDVFSLGATLFYLLLDRYPFGLPRPGSAPKSIAEQMRRRIENGLPDEDSALASIPSGIETLLRSSLMMEPAERPTMKEFVGTLREELNAALVASIPAIATAGQSSGRPRLSLDVARVESDGSVATLISQAAIGAGGATRDIRRVPPAPERVFVRTGDDLRVDATVSVDGHVALLNVGPGGALNVLLPSDPRSDAWPVVRAGRPFRVSSLRVELPAGSERLVLLWSSHPRPFDLGEVASRPGHPEASGGLSRGAVASRDIADISEHLAALPPDQWASLVLDLDHG